MAFFLLHAAPSHAASTGSFSVGGGAVSLSAEHFSRDFDKGLVEVSGQVQLVFKDQFISCDRAIINEKQHLIEAHGNLVISSAQSYIEGDSAILDYRDNTGVIQNGYVKTGQVSLEGKIVRKTGPDTYEAEHSNFTACTTCPAAWTFSGTSMNARMGGYAFIKNPILEIANLPVFWLPYLVVPLKTERQTGLLTPGFAFYPNEVAIGLPFFWAIDRSQDATFTAKYYTRRGLKGLGNYRYMLSEQSFGEANFGAINDHIFGSDPALASFPGGGGSSRWFVNYEHRYTLPENFTQKTKLNVVSDLQYPRDFWLETPGKGDPALENRFSLTRNSETTHFSIDVGYYINAIKSNPFSDNQDAVHRWPEIRYSLTDRQVLGTNLLFRFNANYVNFARRGPGFDDVIAAAPDGSYPRQIDTTRTGRASTSPGSQPANIFVGGGGVFNPQTDIVRTGQRIDLTPEISYPLHAGAYLDILPSLQIRHTQYAFNVTPPSNDTTQYDVMPYRQYMRGQIALRTTFYRIYGHQHDETKETKALQEPNEMKTSRWSDNESREDLSQKVNLIRPRVSNDIYRHEIQPEIVTSYVPYIQQPAGHPFFLQGSQIPVFLEEQPVSDENFNDPNNTVQFDYYDRLSNRTLLTVMFNNRLVRKRLLSGTPDYRQIAGFKIGQRYDFDEARRSNPPQFPYSDIFGILDVHVDRVDVYSSIRYFPYHRVTNSSSYFKLKSERGTEFALISYNQSYDIKHKKIDEKREGPQTVGFGLGFNSKYLDLIGSLNFAPEALNLKLTAWTADLNIKPPGNCWGIKLNFTQPIGTTRPEFHLDFDFNFGGETG